MKLREIDVDRMIFWCSISLMGDRLVDDVSLT